MLYTRQPKQAPYPFRPCSCAKPWEVAAGGVDNDGTSRKSIPIPGCMEGYSDNVNLVLDWSASIDLSPRAPGPTSGFLRSNPLRQRSAGISPIAIVEFRNRPAIPILYAGGRVLVGCPGTAHSHDTQPMLTRRQVMRKRREISNQRPVLAQTIQAWNPGFRSSGHTSVKRLCVGPMSWFIPCRNERQGQRGVRVAQQIPVPSALSLPSFPVISVPPTAAERVPYRL